MRHLRFLRIPFLPEDAVGGRYLTNRLLVSDPVVDGSLLACADGGPVFDSDCCHVRDLFGLVSGC